MTTTTLYVNNATKTISAMPPADLEAKRGAGQVITIGPMLGIPLDFANRQISALVPDMAPEAIIEITFITSP